MLVYLAQIQIALGQQLLERQKDENSCDKNGISHIIIRFLSV